MQCDIVAYLNYGKTHLSSKNVCEMSGSKMMLDTNIALYLLGGD